jgi:hypothetical protein
MSVSDKDEILAAIAGLSDRLDGIESRLAAVEDASAKTLRAVERLDRKANAIARRLHAPSECIALGIQDARADGPVPLHAT